MGVAMLRKLTIQQHGRSSRPGSPRVGCLVLAVAGALAACTGGTDEPVEPAPPPAETDPEPPDAAPDPDPASDPVPGDADALEETWAAFQAAWAEQAAEDDPDPGAFEGLTVDPDATIELLDALRAGGRLVTTEQELWPRFEIDGDRAEVVDCVIAAQHPTGQPDSLATVTISWDATAVVTDDGWRVDSAQPGELFCVAEELNDQLLAAYEDFRAAKNAAWDPPDSDHPDLETTMAGEQLTFIRELLAEHQREGIVIRDPAPTDNAVVFDLGIGRATVSDCTVQVPERGAFDLTTGDRLDDLIPPIRDGQLDGQSVELERQPDGSWLVVDQAGTRDTDCVPGSTRYAVS
jgi:hypothetical protein